MRIKVLPPPGCDLSRLDSKYWLDMPEGSTVSDVLKVIRCSKIKAKLLLISVNGERTSLNSILHDSDVVGFFFPAAGG